MAVSGLRAMAGAENRCPHLGDVERWGTGTTVAIRLVRILLAGILTVLFLGAATLLVEIAKNRPYQVDEVEHVHAAYEMHVGRLIYRDFRQFHNPLLYPLLSPVIDSADPAASFHRARVVTTGFLFATILLSGFCAYRLSNGLGGLLVVGLALTETTLVERGMEVRPDGAVALCTAAGLAIELSGLERKRRYVLEGLVLSAAFLFTNKAVFVCLAFGCLWLVTAVRRRSLGLILRPMAAWVLPLAAAAGIMAWLGNLGQYFRLNILAAASEALGTTSFSPGSFGPWGFVRHEGLRNPLFFALALAGLAYGASAWWSGWRTADPALRFTTFLGAVLLASLWLNPYPYPYLQVTVLPTLAVLAGAAVGSLAGKGRSNVA